MGYQMPLNYFDSNLVFGEKFVWAYYEIPGFYYEFLAKVKKEQKMLNQSAAFIGIKVEFHMLVAPVEQEIEKITQEYEKQIKGPLREVGIEHNRQVSMALREKYNSSKKPKFYIGVKMTPYEVDGLKESFKVAIEELKKSIYKVADIYTVTESEIEKYKRAEKQIFKRLTGYMKAKRVDESQVVHLVERNFTRGIKKISSSGAKIAYQMRDGKRHVEITDVRRLTEGLVDSPELDYLKVSNNGQTTYMTFMPISFFVYESEAIGNEFIYHVQEFDFPVEMSIRAKLIDNESSRRTAKGKKEGLEEEIKFAEESGKSAPQEVIEGEEGLHNLEYDLKKSRNPLLQMSTVLCVFADTVEEMRMRANIVKEEYKSVFDMTLEQPHGDQFMLFNEFLPGAELHVTDYMHVVEPNFLASGMFGATKELGDPYGFFIGVTGANNQPVFINPILAAQGLKGTITNSLSIGITGQMGGGKSLTVNDICYHVSLSGGRVLIFDPKSERGRWLEYLPELGKQLNIVTLSSDEEYRGLLDPWYVMSGRAAESLAMSICTGLLGGVSRDPRFKRISKAVKAVGSESEPCMTKVLKKLLESEDKWDVEVGEDLQAFEDISFSILLFGNGKPIKTISLESAMNVLQVRDLVLPEKGKEPKDYKLEEILSVALMTSINAFGEKFVEGDRGILKVFVNEEAWASLNSNDGKRLSAKLTREGRALNSAIYYVSQDVAVLESVVRDNIGMKFAFRCKDDEEVEAVLKFFDMEKNADNVELLKTLDNGWCLFQDIWGRIGVLYVDPVFSELFEAWDTRPPIVETLEGVG